MREESKSKILQLSGYVYDGEKYVESSLIIDKEKTCMYSGLSKEEMFDIVYNSKIRRRKEGLKKFKTYEMLKALIMLDYSVFISSGEDEDFFNMVEDFKYVEKNSIKNIVFVSNVIELENMENYKDIITSADLIVFTDKYNEKEVDGKYFNDFFMMINSSFLVSVTAANFESVSSSSLFNAPNLKLNGMNIDILKDFVFKY